MTLRTVRARIAATDERSDQAKPGELEAPLFKIPSGCSTTSLQPIRPAAVSGRASGAGHAISGGPESNGGQPGSPEVGRVRAKPEITADQEQPGERVEAPRRTGGPCHGEMPVKRRERGGVLGSQLQPRQTGLTAGKDPRQVSTVTHHEGAGKSNAVKPRVKQQGKANDRTLSPRSAEPRVVVASIEAPGVAVALQSESDLVKLARPRLQPKCPVCDGPTSSLTGGACLTCRRKMDAAMNAQMRQLADDREFQRELEEALERLPESGKTKACAAGCGKQLAFNYWSDICGEPECVAWALGERERRWDVETEIAIRLAERDV